MKRFTHRNQPAEIALPLYDHNNLKKLSILLIPQDRTAMINKGGLLVDTA